MLDVPAMHSAAVIARAYVFILALACIVVGLYYASGRTTPAAVQRFWQDWMPPERYRSGEGLRRRTGVGIMLLGIYLAALAATQYSARTLVIGSPLFVVALALIVIGKRTRRTEQAPLQWQRIGAGIILVSVLDVCLLGLPLSLSLVYR